MKENYRNDPINREDIGKYFPEIFDVFSHKADGKYAFIMNIKNNYAYWSDETVEYFGLTGNRVYNPIEDWGNKIEPHDREMFFENINDVFSGKLEEHNITYRIKNVYDEYITCSCRGKIIYGDNGEKLYFAGTIINHQKNAVIDPVTGLHNRSGLFLYMKNLHRDNKNYYFLMTGLKQFFKVNYSYGYDFGNQILGILADMWRDITEEGIAFRTEGTKMVLIFEADKYTKEDIDNKYKKITNKLKQGVECNGCTVFLSTYACLYQSSNFDLDVNTIYNCALFAANKTKKEEIHDLFLVTDDLF